MRRARRVYQLTDAGQQRFAELVADMVGITTPTTGSACTSPSSTALRPRPGCGS